MSDNSDNKKGFDFSELAHNVFLAGVGAAAIVGEKAGDVVSDLVKKGELTVSQGKAVNEELTKKAADTMSDATASVLRAQMKNMTPEQRADFVSKVQSMAAEVEAKAADQAAAADESADEVVEAAETAAEEAAVEPDAVEDGDDA